MNKKVSRKVSDSRRTFLKMTAAGATGIALSASLKNVIAASSASSAPSTLNKWPGRVVVNFNKAAIGTSGADASVIKKMVDDAVLKLTDQTTLAAAWKSIFPDSLSATSKIAIKIPIGFNDGLACPHWSSVQAIVEGLKQMDFSGTKFPAANITIYDMAGSGSYTTSGYTAANFPGVTIIKDTAVNGGDGALNNRTYAQSLKNATFLINVFSPRGHALPPAGSKFTLGFKCHYGTYSNPGGMHDNIPSNIRELTCTGPVYKKLVLSVCSGIYGMNEGNGPTGSADNFSTYSKTMDSASTATSPTTIIMSTDPVSTEMQAIKIMRINKGGKYTASDMPPYLQASAGLTASGFSPTYNIGTIDESKMVVRKILNGNFTPVLNPAAGPMNASSAAIVAHHLKGHNSTFIEFKLPAEHAGKDASIEFYDAGGALVRKLSQKVQGVQNQLSWDELNERGNPVAKGTYIVRLNAGSIQASTRCSIIR